jgi:hypothetical protein
MKYLLVVLLLASCGFSPTYMDNKAKQTTQRHMLQCEEMGYKRDTEDFRQCVVRLHGQKIEIR